MRHRARVAVSPRFPVLVTIQLRSGLARLRQKREFAAICAAFAAGCAGTGTAAEFRLCQFAVRDAQLQLLVEARDRDTLSRGMQGLLVRVAKRLNREWQKRGSVFADRYDDEVLKTPQQVRQALCRLFGEGVRFTSAAWFDGLRPPAPSARDGAAAPVARARSSLLTTDWRRLGLIGNLRA